MIIKSTIGITTPYGSQNYVLNPSGEGGGNYAPVGTATVSISTSVQKYGLSSYSIQMAANGDGLELELLDLGNTPHYFTARIRTDNQPVDLTFSIGATSKTPVLLEKIDPEWSLYGVSFSAGESNGETTAEITLSGSGTPGIWADGIQIEPLTDKGKWTTYIDGTQEGCAWLGAPHASASIRSGDSRAGGVVQSFWEGYHFLPEKILGGGAAVEELNIDSYAFLPGGELNSSKIPPREFSIIGFFLGNSAEELHEKAQTLELELGLNTYPGRQPVRLRYTGAKVQKEIAARYAGGLEGDLPIYYNDDRSVENEKWVRNYEFKMRASIQFIATDPFWYEVGESAALLDTNDTATFRVVAGRLRETGQWNNLGPPGVGGTYNSILSIAEDDTYVYFGGNFLNFDGIAAADYMVRYHKITGVYSALGTGGPNNEVHAMAWGSDGRLYVAHIGTLPSDSTGVWDPVAETWSALGSGVVGGANTVIASPDGLMVYGGNIPDWVQTWNPASSSWTSLAGLDGRVRALVYSQGTLYAAGDFTGRFKRRPASTWLTAGSGVDNDAYSLAASPDGRVFIGGLFTGFVAWWNGVIVQELPGNDSINDNVTSLSWGPDGNLYMDAGAAFVFWNGSTITQLDFIPPGTMTGVNPIYSSKYVDPVVPSRYSLYVGFNTAGTGAFAGSADASNSGTTPAFPKIIFSRSGGTGATIRTLRNERTGRELLFSYSLLDGESLTVDLNPKNRTIVSSFFGRRMDARLKNDDFSVWQLLPRENQVTAFVSESGSPTVTAYLLFRDAYGSYN